VLCYVGDHLELHGCHFLFVCLSMHAYIACLGQIDSWIMHQYSQELVRQCRLLDRHGLYHFGASNAHHIQVISPFKPKGGTDVCVCTRSLVIMPYPFEKLIADPYSVMITSIFRMQTLNFSSTSPDPTCKSYTPPNSRIINSR
jgi:hypothetical protein